MEPDWWCPGVTATLTLRAYTGTDAATESTSQSGVALVDVDDLTGGSVDPGTNSYERWIALKIDSPPTTGVSNFWFQNTGALPAGVTIRFGVTDAAATPTAATSSIATMELVAGRRYIFDTNTYSETGEKTRYLVLQAQVLSTAVSGAIEQQDPVVGWTEN